MRTFLLLFFFFLIPATSGIIGIFAQLAVQLERYGQERTEKFFRGDEIRYQLINDDLWRDDPIQEIRPDLNSLILSDRYISLDEIERIDLGNNRFMEASGIGLQTFGAGWAFWALLGYAVDGNPDTRFGEGDLIVSVGSVAVGLLLRKLSRRQFRLDERRRLRIVDLNF